MLLLLLFQSLEVVVQPPSPTSEDTVSLPPPVEPVTPPRDSAETPTTSPEPDTNSSETAPPIAANPDATETSVPANDQRGTLRVSNQTLHPIRVALLPQLGMATDENGTGAIASDLVGLPLPDAYREPVHWDFAPNEGEVSGLILSLPDGGLEVQTGDIIAAFAEDGSRRYWGPYVVGVTPLPTWNGETAEWELPLRSPQPDSP
ncbi:MAG: hypothetical protein VKK04_09805 [Synechococcales bacterium]|nr:hypothetical protein [Synechococcales bacterium]